MRVLSLPTKIVWEKAYEQISACSEIRNCSVINLYVAEPEKRTHNPDFRKICDGFGITLSQFFAEDDKVLDLTKDQEELLKDWNSMDSRQQELVKAYIQGIIRK